MLKGVLLFRKNRPIFFEKGVTFQEKGYLAKEKWSLMEGRGRIFWVGKAPPTGRHLSRYDSQCVYREYIIYSRKYSIILVIPTRSERINFVQNWLIKTLRKLFLQSKTQEYSEKMKIQGREISGILFRNGFNGVLKFGQACYKIIEKV